MTEFSSLQGAREAEYGGDADNLTFMVACHHLQLSTAYVVVIGRPFLAYPSSRCRAGHVTLWMLRGKVSNGFEFA